VAEFELYDMPSPAAAAAPQCAKLAGVRTDGRRTRLQAAPGHSLVLRSGRRNRSAGTDIRRARSNHHISWSVCVCVCCALRTTHLRRVRPSVRVYRPTSVVLGRRRLLQQQIAISAVDIRHHTHARASLVPHLHSCIVAIRVSVIYHFLAVYCQRMRKTRERERDR